MPNEKNNTPQTIREKIAAARADAKRLSGSFTELVSGLKKKAAKDPGVTNGFLGIFGLDATQTDKAKQDDKITKKDDWLSLWPSRSKPPVVSKKRKLNLEGILLLVFATAATTIPVSRNGEVVSVSLFLCHGAVVDYPFGRFLSDLTGEDKTKVCGRFGGVFCDQIPKSTELPVQLSCQAQETFATREACQAALSMRTLSVSVTPGETRMCIDEHAYSTLVEAAVQMFR